MISIVSGRLKALFINWLPPIKDLLLTDCPRLTICLCPHEMERSLLSECRNPEICDRVSLYLSLVLAGNSQHTTRQTLIEHLEKSSAKGGREKGTE